MPPKTISVKQQTGASFFATSHRNSC